MGFVKKLRSASGLFWLTWSVAMVLGVVTGFATQPALAEKLKVCIGVFFWGAVAGGAWLCRCSSALHSISVEELTSRQKVCILLIIGVVILACTVPMGFFPQWNGTLPEHRNQYELTAEAFLDGRLYIHYGDEGELLALENPYDRVQREASGAAYHWDHAFYNGRYYMYFGVVPVLLVFLPFRLLTGMSLTTYHGTQLFVALAILGIFALFHLFSRLFFRKLPVGIYVSLAAASSLICVWNSIASPALYCTAITAAIALEVWSIWFFVRAVWDIGKENRQILFAGIGALLGALTFGCRPTIGLANLLVLPALWVFLKGRKLSWKLIGKLFLAALPYVVVAAGLMAYNYARFDNPFEFGQSYQITIADQRDLGGFADNTVRLRLINETIRNFIGYADVTAEFPHLSFSGAFVNFPVLLLCLGIFRKDVRGALKENRMFFFAVALGVTVWIVTLFDVLWSPELLERYRMDIYYLMVLLSFLVAGLWHSRAGEGKKTFSTLVMYLSLWAVVVCVFYYIRDLQLLYPGIVALCEECICFWKLL